jgi:hypothetical protein
MAHNYESSGNCGGAWGWSWTCTLNKRPSYELTRSGFIVPLECRLPAEWNISTGGYPIPPLPCGKELIQLIEARCRALPEEDRADPSYGPRSDLWRLIFADKRKARVEAFNGSVRPLQYNKIGCHAWWDGRDYENVMARWSAGLPPRPKRTVSSPNSTASSSFSRSATSRHSLASMHPCPRRGMPGISFRAPKKEPPSPPCRQLKKPKPVAGASVKVEPGIVKVEPGSVKV